MDSKNAEIVIRPAELVDKSFIMSSWLKGNYYKNPYFVNMEQDLYFKEYAKHIESILFTPGVMIDIACDKEDPSWIVGYMIYRGPVLYWIFVKNDFRNKGIATLLAKDKNITTTTALTKSGQAIGKSKGVIFNPFA